MIPAERAAQVERAWAVDEARGLVVEIGALVRPDATADVGVIIVIILARSGTPSAGFDPQPGLKRRCGSRRPISSFSSRLRWDVQSVWLELQFRI